MSQDQTTISVLEMTQASSYLEQALNALFVFEYMITLGQEINIWKRRYSLSTALFALTRYSSLAANLQTIFLDYITIPNRQSCKAALFTGQGLSALQYLCFATFTAFRAYSLLPATNLNLLLSGIIYALSLVPFAANIVLSFTSTVVYFADISACTEAISISAHLNLRLSVATRVSATIADILVLGVTWYRTATIYRAARKHGIDSPLTRLLVRDGTLYFAVLLLMNVLIMLFNNIPSLEETIIISTQLQQSVVPILICRFMMNLHDIAPSETISEHGRTWSSIRFVGDMGQTLRVPGEEEDEERWDDELSQDQEQQQEASSSADLPSEIESRAQGHECGGEETTSRSQSAEGVVGEGA